METFGWKSQAGATKNTSFKKGRNDFGDGYTQHYTIGINPIIDTWSVTILEEDFGEGLEDFLDAHKGILPFLWVPPGKLLPIEVICEAYGLSYLGMDAVSMSATFERFQKAKVG